MMDPFKIEVILNTSIGRKKSGVLHLEFSENIFIENINATIDIELRGRMRSEHHMVVAFQVAENLTVLKNQSLEIPFSFILPNNLVQTYKGANVDVGYKMEVTTRIDKEDFKKLDLDFLKKVTSFFLTFSDAGHSLKSNTYFVYKPEETYQVSSEKNRLKLKYNFIKALLFMGIPLLIYGIFCLFYTTPASYFYLIGIVVASGALVFFDKQNTELSIGNLYIVTKPKDADHFYCTLQKSHKFKLSELTAYYRIREKVVDKRGTSDSTYNETIFRSPLKNLSQSNNTIEFAYPKRFGLNPFEKGPTELYWELTLAGKHNDFKEQLSCRIYN